MDLSATTMIHAPADVVYRYVSDPANDVNWRTGVTESGLTTDPPLALGSEGYVEPPLLHWTLQKESYMCNTSTTIVSPQADATPNGRS